MSADWRISLATDLAIRCHVAGVRAGDRTAIQSAIFTLAEQEQRLLQSNTHDPSRPQLGYARAVSEYGKNGMGMLISMTVKYWPVVAEHTTSDLAPVKFEEPLPKSSPTTSPAVKKREPSTLVLQDVDLTLQITMDQVYDGSSVLSTLSAHVGDMAKLVRVCQAGEVIDVFCVNRVLIGELYDKLLEVSWITDIISKPSGMFGKIFVKRLGTANGS